MILLMGRFLSRYFLVCLIGAIAFVVGVSAASAAVIVGPPVTVNGTDVSWGLQFTAVQNSVLTGFDYSHLAVQGVPSPFTGNITLTDITTSTPLFSQNYLPGSPNPVIGFSGLNIGLTAGHNYQLIATSDTQFGARDEKFAYVLLGTYPVSNADISVTSGVVNGINTGFGANQVWYAFNNITTAAAGVPEPASLAIWSLISLTGAGLGWLRRKRTSTN